MLVAVVVTDFLMVANVIVLGVLVQCSLFGDGGEEGSGGDASGGGGGCGGCGNGGELASDGGKNKNQYNHI